MAGVDVAYDDPRGVVAAAVVLIDFASLESVEEATAVGAVSFPYVPGLLAFRELPSILDALASLRHVPDLIMCDGYGFAHPRRLGLASHLGVLTDLPTAGVAKNPFMFSYSQPGQDRGDWSALMDGAEVVGRALRTRAGAKPLFVSVGHRIGIAEASDATLELAPKYRLPETTRRADALCRRTLAESLR
ncbi:endonuclease V [Amycolatopsis sp. WGS_07]|uniref:endonuclease V n=1 Tax=Amycolatopsis sp. WGS_07 TaxID=3076764 RepID=UPI003873ACBE